MTLNDFEWLEALNGHFTLLQPAID